MVQSVSKRFLKFGALIVCVAVIIFGFAAKPSFAAQSLSLSASDFANSQVTVTVNFPMVDWSGGFKILMNFDSSVLEYVSCSCNISGFSFDKNASGGTLTMAGSTSFDEGYLSTQRTAIAVVFNIKDVSKTSTAVSCSAQEFFDYNGNTVVDGTAQVTVTLPGSGSTSSTTPPPSTSTTSDTPSNPTSSTDTPSNPSSSTKTDPPASTSSSTNTNTNTTTKTSSTKTSSKDSSTKTDTDTGTQSDSVTDSESLTDTETNFPISDTATDTETNVTDKTDGVSDEPSVTWGSTVITATPDPEPKGISTGIIALISIGVAVVFCAVLTVIGLLRHKKEEQ